VASPSAAPQPVTGSYGVLVGSQAASSYAVSIVGVDGKVVASAQATTPVAVSCAGAAAAVVPPAPVSTSNSRVYFEDGQGLVHYLGPAGDTGRVTTIPAGTASSRAMFAVSPDDQRIAVVVVNFSSTGASTRIYVEDLNGGGNRVDLFTESGSYSLWPIGWHGTNNLVLAKVVSCTQGGGPFCCGPLELHVVDPATANRRFTIGNSPSCIIAGPASPAGAVCESSPSFVNAQEINWTAGVISTFQVGGPSPAFISPDGNAVAIVNYASGVTNIRNGGSLNLQACQWIDSTHLMSGGDAQQQPRVGNTSNSSVVPVAAQGDCGGRIPGGL
jgi:hypothetical protein